MERKRDNKERKRSIQNASTSGNHTEPRRMTNPSEAPGQSLNPPRPTGHGNLNHHTMNPYNNLFAYVMEGAGEGRHQLVHRMPADPHSFRMLSSALGNAVPIVAPVGILRPEQLTEMTWNDLAASIGMDAGYASAAGPMWDQNQAFNRRFHMQEYNAARRDNDLDASEQSAYRKHHDNYMKILEGRGFLPPNRYGPPAGMDLSNNRNDSQKKAFKRNNQDIIDLTEKDEDESGKQVKPTDADPGTTRKRSQSPDAVPAMKSTHRKDDSEAPEIREQVLVAKKANDAQPDPKAGTRKRRKKTEISSQSTIQPTTDDTGSGKNINTEYSGYKVQLPLSEYDPKFTNSKAQSAQYVVKVADIATAPRMEDMKKNATSMTNVQLLISFFSGDLGAKMHENDVADSLCITSNELHDITKGIRQSLKNKLGKRSKSTNSDENDILSTTTHQEDLRLINKLKEEIKVNERRIDSKGTRLGVLVKEIKSMDATKILEEPTDEQMEYLEAHHMKATKLEEEVNAIQGTVEYKEAFTKHEKIQKLERIIDKLQVELNLEKEQRKQSVNALQKAAAKALEFFIDY